MNKNLLILGAGQFGMIVKETAESTCAFDKIAFLDDSFTNSVPPTGNGVDIIGSLQSLCEFTGQYRNAIVSIGNPKVRKQWTQRLQKAGYNIPTLISPYAYVSPSATISKGAVIEPMAAVNTDAYIGECAFVTAGAVVDHNAYIDGYCNIQCNAVVTARTRLAEFTVIGPCEIVKAI